MIFTPRLLWVTLGLVLAVVVLPGLFWLWMVLLAALILADVLLAGSPRRLRVVREPVGPLRSSETTTAGTRVENSGSRAVRGWVKDGWQPTAGAEDGLQRLQVPAGGAITVQVRLTPKRRGDLRSEHITIRSIGPMGLAGRQVVHHVAHELRVLPEFRSRRHLPSKLRRLRELDGTTAVQLRGAGTEFDSLRDYVRGDDVRSIDWRATARRQDGAGGHLVVRTWRPERDRRVILCLDASRTSAARVEDEPRLNAGIEAALLLGALASSAGDRVDFMAFQRQLVARASSSERGDFLNLMATSMAPVEPVLVEADFSQLPAQVASVSSHRSLVVVLTALDSASLQEGLLPVLPALTAKHRVVVASVQDPELQRRGQQRGTAAQVYRAAAAERTLIEHRTVAAELSAMGVEVVEAAPEELPPALADAYIRLKATGKL
ncbi:DUF58 domain-containing protein [Nesterenkonia rhizosphaerae]|uniref:DUF58 domain-containing protein n=1 Tax=Nesterenkonia rhizosphaerae TaxID=1348272 RepID=A0ABP9FSH6_9MICC